MNYVLPVNTTIAHRRSSPGDTGRRIKTHTPLAILPETFLPRPKMDLNSAFWRFCEWFYAMPEPPPRERTKPMQVLCVGFPRSGTESLQNALLMLGYDHTYHVRTALQPDALSFFFPNRSGARVGTFCLKIHHTCNSG